MFCTRMYEDFRHLPGLGREWEWNWARLGRIILDLVSRFNALCLAADYISTNFSRGRELDFMYTNFRVLRILYFSQKMANWVF